MLKDLLDEQNLSAYALSKQTGIPYMTLNDLLTGKSSMEKVSASLLYQLARALGVSMEDLYLGQQEKKLVYLYNRGRNVILEYGNAKVRMQGAESLIAFRRIKEVRQGKIHAEAWVEKKNGSIGRQVVAVDAGPLLEKAGADGLALEKLSLKIGRPNQPKRDELRDAAILVSDHMAILLDRAGSKEGARLAVVPVSRPTMRALIRLSDGAVISSNMKETMLNRAVAAVVRNRALIASEIEEGR